MVISFGTCSGSGLFSGRLAEQKYHNETHLFLKTAISRGTSEKLFFSKFTPRGVNFFSCTQFWTKKCVRMFTGKNETKKNVKTLSVCSGHFSKRPYVCNLLFQMLSSLCVLTRFFQKVVFCAKHSSKINSPPTRQNHKK